jgi:hypothetical protein
MNFKLGSNTERIFTQKLRLQDPQSDRVFGDQLQFVVEVVTQKQQPATIIEKSKSEGVRNTVDVMMRPESVAN